MSRIKPIERENMSEEQAAIYDDIVAKGGRLGGPYTAYIRIPRFMKLNQEMGNYLRSNKLAPRLRQLAAIIAIRHWGAKFAWAMNAQDAIEQGVSPDILEAINRRQRPDFQKTDEQIVYDVVSELLASKVISDKSYSRASDILGEEALVDLVVTVGFFSMVSMTLVSFGIDPPPDAAQRLMD